MNGSEAAANQFHEAVRATGCITANELHHRSGINSKTIRADIRSGRLPATRTVLCGREVLLIQPADAAAYTKQRRREIQKTQARAISFALAGRRPPRGFWTVPHILRQFPDVSPDRLRQAIRDGRLKATGGDSAWFVHHATFKAFYRRHAAELARRPVGKRSKKKIQAV